MILIDRTIPELIKINPEIVREDLGVFLGFLERLGIGLVELDENSLVLAGNIPSKLGLLYRIDREVPSFLKDLNRIYAVILDVSGIIRGRDIRTAAVKLENLKREIGNSIKIIMEITMDSPEELEAFIQSEMKDNKESNILAKVDSLRIKGLPLAVPLAIERQIKVLKESSGVHVDICPVDSYSCASAVGAEASVEGADFITGTICGIGHDYGYAALEEIILALKVIYKKDFKAETEILPKVRELFEKMTIGKVSAQKPVLGEEIFFCESGIHVDGILKKPESYEPYPPELIGQKRRFTLGKHSGAAAVESRIRELKLTYPGLDLSKLVERIRDKSIEIKGYINDDMLQSLAEECRWSESQGGTRDGVTLQNC